MTFVSSFRPHSGNAEYALNQKRAVASWVDKADQIVLFGEQEPELDADNVVFIQPQNAWPSIKEMARIAAAVDDEACLINADIVVGESYFSALDAWRRNRGMSATSRRFQYEPKIYPKSLSTASVVDQGFDFFMARKPMWQLSLDELPDQMWIGHCLWDNWMLGFFALNASQFHFNLTRFRFIFHPKHGNRKQPMIVNVQSRYIPHHGWGKSL